MKWLKKTDSENEEISNAGSKQGPGHALEQAPAKSKNPEPDTVRQPKVVAKKEAESPVASTTKPTGRRREMGRSEEQKPEKKPSFSFVRNLQKSWLGQNWKTFAILLTLFCVAFFVRSYYGLQPATEDGILLSGGSDSYYYHYVIQHGTEHGEHRFYDYMLSYPVFSSNPRPPLFNWPITVIGMGLSPLFDGDVYTSTLYVFIFATAFFGAVTIFPVYLLGKEAFGKRTGIIAAFILAFLPGHITRSVITNADHDSAALLFIVLTFYFFLKALKTVTPREWVISWNKPGQVIVEIRAFIRENPQSILYGMLSGLSITATALAWQGFAYVVVVLSLYFLFQVIINRFRNVDTFGVFAIYFVSLATGLGLALPYYYLSYQFLNSWFGAPFYLFLGLSAFSLFMIVTRKYPWILVFAGFAALTLLSLLLIRLIAPAFFESLISQLLSVGGYVIRTKQYETIAEAQAPPFSNLALSFGIFTFWLSLIGIAWAAIQLPKSWKPDFTFILLWAGTSIYLAISAARFMFNASPAFAITSAWIIAIIIEKLDFKRYVDELRRASKPHMPRNFKVGLFLSVIILVVVSLVLAYVSSMAYPVLVIGFSAIVGLYMLNLIAETNPNRIYNLLTVLIPTSGTLFYLFTFYSGWEYNDATHVFILGLMLFGYLALFLQVRKISFFFTMGILFLSFCIVVPNVWAGLDAGIPYESKSRYDKEIYNSMPVFMQPDDYDAINGSNWYLGGFGYSLPLNSRYWPAAYRWLATQDADIYPDHKKPAFLSWWDYGFEIVNQARHPTVADNFLGGHQLAGNFIMAQSEKDAIALMCVRLLEGNWLAGRRWVGQTPFFDVEVKNLLEEYGIDPAKLIHIFENPSSYTDIILANPDIYGPRDDDIQEINARYIASRVLITQALDLDRIVGFYDGLSSVTGYSIRYFGIDSRLFPFSSQNTGIFYAPAKLSDHRISDVANQPYDFWEIKAVGEFGGEYDLDNIPPDVNLDPQNPYKLVYKEMFYNSMLYRAFIGYSGQDIGMGDAGIPAVTGSLSSDPIMPGWNMSHFKLVHRTAYWNPYSAEEIQHHTDAWRAMNYWEAYDKQQVGDGISDLSDRSSVYQGVMMLKYYHGAVVSGHVTLENGIPLAGVSVTVNDDFGIPKQRVVTDSNGYYSINAPPGKIELIASVGDIDPLYLAGSQQLNITTMHIEDYQAMRENVDKDMDGIPDYLITQNLVISSSGLSGVVFWDVDFDEVVGNHEETISGARVTIKNSDIPFEASTLSGDSGNYAFVSIPPGSYSIQVSLAGRAIGSHQAVLSVSDMKEKNLAMAATKLEGTVLFHDEIPANGALVRVWSHEDDIEFETFTDSNGTYSLTNILHGRFFTQAEWGAYSSTPQFVEILRNQDNTVDHALYRSFSLSGHVTLNGLPVPYSTIKFAGQSSTVVTTDSSGKYSVKLEDGEYVYLIAHMDRGSTYAAMGRFYFTENVVRDIILQPGCTITGRVVDERGAEAADTQVVFENMDTGIYISAYTDMQGDYSIVIPQGRYRVQVSTPYYGSHYAFRDFASITDNYNIVTRAGTVISGVIYWDVDGDDTYSTEEGLYNARVTFKEPSGDYAMAITDDVGSFSIVLPATTLYHISVARDGFESVEIGMSTIQTLSGIYQHLQPLPIPVTGELYLDGEVLKDQNIVLNFVSEISALPSAAVQVGRDGSYSTQLLPGIYTTRFTHNTTIGNDTNVYQIYQELTFDTGFYSGDTLFMDLDVAERTKISITLSNSDFIGANITFKQGPESRSFDMDTNFGHFYIMPGDYVLTAVHPLNETIMVDMQDINVGGHSNNFTVSLKNGLSFAGDLKFKGRNIPYQSITFKDLDGNGTITVATDENGGYEVILVPNRGYDVQVNFVDYEEEPYLVAHRYFTLNHTIEAIVPKGNHVIDLEREIFTIDLAGSVTRNDLPAPNTLLTFIYELGNYTATSDSNGEFTLEIVPGEYTLFAHQPSSHFVSLSRTMIEIEQIGLDVVLSPGNHLYGTAYYDMNYNAVTDLFFTSSQGVKHTISTDESGYYGVWLPPDNYSVTGEFTVSGDEIGMLYSLDMGIDLRSDRQLNLPFTLNEQRIVFVSFNPMQFKEIRSNSTVTYSFEIENMGNIRDTYNIVATGGNPDWVTEVSMPEIALNPGADNIARLTVSVYVPPNAKMDQNKVTITAISQKNSSVRHSNVMNLIIRQEHDFAIQPSATSPTYVMGELKSEFSILNKGNGAEKLTLYIANNEDLLRSGWIAELGYLDGADLNNANKRLVNVSVTSGGTVNIPIYLYPTGSNPSRQMSVLIIGHSQFDSTVIRTNTVLFKYPVLQITPENLTASGIGVSEARSGDQLTNTAVMAVTVSSALFVFYIARKKRWIK